MDGRAEKSLQVQCVCVLQVGVGKSGILRVSSGSDNPVNHARNRWASNASITNITQTNSKMSELAHAEIGKIDTATNAVGQRGRRTIGTMQTSCIAPERRQNRWQQAQGGVVGPVGGLGQWDRSDCDRDCCVSQSVVLAKSFDCMHVSLCVIVCHCV